MITIRKLRPEEPAPMTLLLLADPSQQHIEDYMQRGQCFIAEKEKDIVGVYVLLPTRPGTIELVNVAVSEKLQGVGIGKQLVQHAIQTSRIAGFQTIEVGTGSTGVVQLALYQKCGFRMVGIDKDFFTRHYQDDIYDNGILLQDMVRLALDL